MVHKNASYNLNADIIRVVAIIGVVLIHTVNAVFGRPDFFGGLSWWFAILLNSLSRIAIPLFIMVSGYFILQKDEVYTLTIKRTWQRLGIPLIIWFMVFLLWNNGEPTLSVISLDIVKRLLSVNVFELYFLIILIGLYLVSPFLKAFLRQSSRQTIHKVTYSMIIIGCLYAIYEYLTNQCSSVNSFTFWFPFTGIFLGGLLWGNKNFTVKNKNIWWGLYLTGLAVTISGSYLYFYLIQHGNMLLTQHNCLSYYTDGYLSINVILMTIAAYICLMHANFSFLSALVKNSIYSIARTSFAIYILHIIYLNILDVQLHIFDALAPAWFYIVIKFSVIFLLSYISARIFLKIPILKRAFGEV